KQLGLYRHPVVILNTNRYYDPLFALFRQAADEQFLPVRPASPLWLEARTPEEAVEMILRNQ
ncbi:MAG: LOG family protein, partial [Tannerella sp.]|nr:LOG family protein [Tannerella sp.]